jgi:hypothetical protein
MTEQESQRDTEERDGKDDEVESAAPKDEKKVVGENADVPAGEGEEADEAGVEGGSESGGDSDGQSGAEASSGEDDDESRSGGDDEADGEDGRGEEDDRDELAKELESDPSRNPQDPVLREIRGG